MGAVQKNQTTSVPTDDSTRGGKGNPIKDVAKMLLGKGAERFGLPGGLMTGTREMAGSAGHQLIYNVGKMFGKTFKPWEAVKMAKGLGQALAFVGIAMSAYEIYEQVNEDAKADEKQRQYEQQLLEARAQIRSLADAMVAQLQEIYQKEYALPVIGVILEKLNAARDRILAQEASNKELVEGLSSQRAQLKGYLQQLYSADQQTAS